MVCYPTVQCSLSTLFLPRISKSACVSLKSFSPLPPPSPPPFECSLAPIFFPHPSVLPSLLFPQPLGGWNGIGSRGLAKS